MNLLALPDCVLEQILEYLSYDDIAKKRLVSSKINRICQSLLNRGIVKLKTSLAKKISKLKPFLPRKESERWDHPAAKKIRYLESIQTERRMLYYVYDNYIEMNMCCFIPGKFIDIAFTILRSGIYPKSWLYDDSLNAMTDASCMAKEHFQEKIEPILKKMKVQTFIAPIKKSSNPPLQAKMDMETDSTICQFQDGGNCRKAYNRINKKYRTVLRKVNLSNKNYNTLLRKFKLNKKAVMKNLTNSQNEIADLRRRLEKFESNNQSEAKVQTEDNEDIVGTTKSLRLSKRLKNH